MARRTKKQPADLYTIDNLETLRLLADPVRIEIMQAFASAPDEAKTVKQVAATLGARPTKLYYHVNLLEEHGLLKVADSRVVSGIIEKSYVPAARNFTVDTSLLSVTEGGREAAAATMAAMLQQAASELAASAGTPAAPDWPKGTPRFHVSKTLGRLAPDEHARFLKRLADVVAEFDGAAGQVDGAEPTHSLVVAFYPLPGETR
ncbi:MAG TPA: helix-turn-helix domain-containing protein [Candidatus Limnocylindrales bacterium]|jgi:DNA-binding transcriptional ArsR family regulator